MQRGSPLVADVKQLNSFVEIAPPTYFSLKAVMKSHGWSALLPFKCNANCLHYTFILPTLRVTQMSLSMNRGIIGCNFDVELESDERAFVAQAIIRILSLDFPLERFAAKAKDMREYELFGLACDGWGRMLRSSTCWEDAVKTLLTTNASWHNTVRMATRLVTCLGARSASETQAFPTASDILRVGEGFVNERCGLGYRSKYLYRLAEWSSEESNQWIHSPQCRLDYASLRDTIIKWPGFGEYATNHLLVLMGDHSRLPVDREVEHERGKYQVRPTYHAGLKEECQENK